MPQKKTLVVSLCMHRSGSSLTSRILTRLGMGLGPFDLLGPSATNKYGYFEAVPIVNLNKQLLGPLLGFEDDLPHTQEGWDQFRSSDGIWQADPAWLEPKLEEGVQLVRQLVEADSISGLKDPRVVLLWPFWQAVFARVPEVRVVPLFILRSPHEVAMSLFMRSRGNHAYRDVLDVTAIHFRRMRDIRRTWAGEQALVRFDLPLYADDLRRATAMIGLPWDDASFAEMYDTDCKHHDQAYVAHEVQTLYEDLSNTAADPYSPVNLVRVEADTTLRERLVRTNLVETRKEYRQLQEEYRQLEEKFRQLESQREIDLYKSTVELEAERRRTEHYQSEVALIKDSRYWKTKEGVKDALRMIGVKR